PAVVSAPAAAATVAAASRAAEPPAAAAPASAPIDPGASAGPTGQGRVIDSPAVRARAWELGLDLARVPPSGTAGRVVQADLDRAQADRPSATRTTTATTPSAPAAGSPGAAASPAATAEAAPRTIKIVGLRRRIAERMQESKRRIPHYTYVEEVDVGALEALRATLNARHGKTRPHLTLLPLLVRALARAVTDWPQVNAHLDDEAGVLTQHAALHVGIATQTDAGLMVPVLRGAATRDLWSSADEIARLAEAARSGRATRDELTGSTITLTSLGRLGGLVSTPVINRPEVAIVGVNRIVMRPVWRDGGVVGRPMMNLSSSFDHRVVDGAVAAGFVQRLRELLEQPATLFVE
ncbi:MAG: dihydrolipoamide acetyltransferase family protein, partial [Rubrivivax sp.]